MNFLVKQPASFELSGEPLTANDLFHIARSPRIRIYVQDVDVPFVFTLDGDAVIVVAQSEAHKAALAVSRLLDDLPSTNVPALA